MKHIQKAQIHQINIIFRSSTYTCYFRACLITRLLANQTFQLFPAASHSAPAIVSRGTAGDVVGGHFGA